MATKTNLLNDVTNEPSLKEMEVMCGLELEDKEYYATVGRDCGPHATRTMRPGQQPGDSSSTSLPRCASVCNCFVLKSFRCFNGKPKISFEEFTCFGIL